MPRHFSRYLAVAFLIAACGCGGGSRKHFAPDSGRNLVPDTPAPVTGDADLDTAAPVAVPDAADTSASETADATLADVPDALDSCAVGLSGAAPFGKVLSGTATFVAARAPVSGTAAPITSTRTVSIYFPAGRVTGAPVQLAVGSLITGRSFFGPSVSLASDLSAAGLWVVGEDIRITGNLLPGDGGLQASVEVNFADPGTDIANIRSASMLMCPTGEVPAPTLRVTGGVFSPLSRLGIDSSTPLSTEALGALRITSPLGAVAIKVLATANSPGSGNPNFTVVPASSAFPPGQPLTFDASEVKDVLGRNVSLSLATTQVLATTAVLDDLSLTATPPTGAMACTDCSVSMFPGVDGGSMLRCTGGGKISNGVLAVSPPPLIIDPAAPTPVVALLALPSSGSTKLRVRMSVGDAVEGGSGCRNGVYFASMAYGTMAVVGPNGESALVALKCDGALTDHVLDLPSASPLWLVVHIQTQAPIPYFGPRPGPPSFSIDELQFM